MIYTRVASLQDSPVGFTFLNYRVCLLFAFVLCRHMTTLMLLFWLWLMALWSDQTDISRQMSMNIQYIQFVQMKQWAVWGLSFSHISNQHEYLFLIDWHKIIILLILFPQAPRIKLQKYHHTNVLKKHRHANHHNSTPIDTVLFFLLSWWWCCSCLHLQKNELAKTAWLAFALEM